VAKQYQNRGLSLNDLVNEANLGLIKAAGRFDETRGFKFISFAVWWIRQSVMEAISNHSRIVRLPMNKVGVLNKYGATVSKMEQTLGRTPTVMEVAEHLGVDDSELSAIEGYMFKHTSLDSKVYDSEETTVAETMSDENIGTPSDRLFKDSLRTDIDRVFDVLTLTERNVLKNYFGLKCRAMSLEEIGEKMGCTKERVRQIKVKALKKMKEGNRHKILQQYV
jgi:RNA polymerase primary sigma factor